MHKQCKYIGCIDNENIIFDTLDNLPEVKKVLYTIVYINK